MDEILNNEIIRRIVRIGAISRLTNCSCKIVKTEDEWDKICARPLHIIHSIIVELGIDTKIDYNRLMDLELTEIDLGIIDDLLKLCYENLT
ncbi:MULTISPECIES: hypothetical protein [unclassified Fusibacter]|uniref:hypothetical protein n=1 Tax=unclassified Fusibacter TaxID=2624464 RepID=UPI001012A55B|nr:MULTISPECIES: hypothetical protein [unclassified Fusibacter]MCK8060095.1 hypothetical protein [Fusibacter sp. A2]NPE22237.1 hypothetical protein [Fusibacter sp. A1]RXV61011.1 hypothetical protein DWB64_10355 [Fusibacter sp. A1]